MRPSSVVQMCIRDSIEADLESDVDALKIKEAGVASVELNTRGVCHVEMGLSLIHI